MSRFSDGGLRAGGGEKNYELCARTWSSLPWIPRACGDFAGGLFWSFDADRTLMSINNFRDDGQSQADAAFLGGHEGIKDLFPQLQRNPRPGVRNAHFDPVESAAATALGTRFADIDEKLASAGTHGIVAILHNINECLLAQALIQRHQWQIRLILFLHPNLSSLPKLRHIIQGTIENRGDVLRRQIRVQRTGEIQEARDQGAQT